MNPDPGPLASENSDQMIRFNLLRFLSGKKVQYHLSRKSYRKFHSNSKRSMSFIEELATLRICLFRYAFCRNLAKLVICVVFTLLLSTMVSVSPIYCWHIARLHICCFCLSHAHRMFNLGQNWQNSEANIWEPALGHVYTGADKFLHGQKCARFHLAFARHLRN